MDTLITVERFAALAHYANDEELAVSVWRNVLDKLNDTDGPRGLRTAIAQELLGAPATDRREVGAQADGPRNQVLPAQRCRR
jgi:hypothetical protein